MIRLVLALLACDLVVEALRADTAAGLIACLIGAALAAMLAIGGGK